MLTTTLSNLSVISHPPIKYKYTFSDLWILIKVASPTPQFSAKFRLYSVLKLIVPKSFVRNATGFKDLKKKCNQEKK